MRKHPDQYNDSQPKYLLRKHDAERYPFEHAGVSCWVCYEAINHYILFNSGLSSLPVSSTFPEYFEFTKSVIQALSRLMKQKTTVD